MFDGCEELMYADLLLGLCHNGIHRTRRKLAWLCSIFPALYPEHFLGCWLLGLPRWMALVVMKAGAGCKQSFSDAIYLILTLLASYSKELHRYWLGCCVSLRSQTHQHALNGGFPTMKPGSLS